MDEPVLRPPEKRLIMHEYGEPLSAELQVYCLEEIVVEKLRALLQQAEMFERTGLEPFKSSGLLRPLASAG